MVRGIVHRMALSRQYRRDSQGRFAGAGAPGAKVTQGKAGGFANATFRARVANDRAAAKHKRTLVRKGVKAVAAGAGAAAAAGTVRAAVGGRGRSPAANKVQTSNPGTVGKVLKGAARAVGKAGKSLS